MNEIWVSEMARCLVCEVTDQMSGIQLKDTEAFAWNQLLEKPMIIFGLIRGDYELHVQLLAEWGLFYRLAHNMMAQEPEEEDVREYALEYFNTICGRFISEVINQKHISVRLYPVRYEMTSKSPILTPGEQLSTLYFLSDQQEQVVFSWTSMPIDNMMRSDKNG